MRVINKEFCGLLAGLLLGFLGISCDGLTEVGDESSAQALTGTALLSDNFEDGNSTGWTIHTTDWTVATDGNKVFQGTNTSGYARASAGSTTWTNQSIEARIKPISWSGSDRFALLAARFVDSNNYYYVTLRSSGKIEIKRLKANSHTTLASKSISVITGTWYKVRLDAIGTSLKAYVNGTLLLSATDSTFAAGKIAVGCYYGKTNFDDVQVTTGTARQRGETCTTNSDCASPNVCSSRVCCDKPCGTCQSCTLAGSVGTCKNLVSGTSCGASSCSGNTWTTNQCNGTGLCSARPQSCGNYTCSTSSGCYSACSTDANCANGYTCIARLCTKSSCSTNADCANGYTCIARLCTQSSCTGPSDCPSGFTCTNLLCEKL